MSELMTNSATPSTSKEHADIEARLRALLVRSEQQLIELESGVTDRDSIQEDRDNVRILIGTIRADALKTRRALTRIEDGTYGRCTSCGELIASDRMQAIPTVDTCARCA